MGGRGVWSEPTQTGFTFYDYHRVYTKGNIHFINQHSHNESGNSAPVMSVTPNVIYGTFGKDGELYYISKYKNRKMIFSN